MLRVTFLASDARTLQTVVSGLAAICEQRGAHEDRFTLYHATPVQASKDEAFAVDLIEIHNDEHTAFCSDLQHVCFLSPYCSSRRTSSTVDCTAALSLSFQLMLALAS